MEYKLRVIFCSSWYKSQVFLSHTLIFSSFCLPLQATMTGNTTAALSTNSTAAMIDHQHRHLCCSSFCFVYQPHRSVNTKVMSFTGFKYYLVLIDDYSHYTWTYPLRHKSDATNTIVHLYAQILNQFHLSIRCLQCDNGDKFINNALCTFLLDCGINYHLSCPYNSSQNGKAERSICTINDIVCTHLIQAHMLPEYWVETLNTSTYLLNCRPSKSIIFSHHT